jgi:hypothetical protein
MSHTNLPKIPGSKIGDMPLSNGTAAYTMKNHNGRRLDYFRFRSQPRGQGDQFRTTNIGRTVNHVPSKALTLVGQRKANSILLPLSSQTCGYRLLSESRHNFISMFVWVEPVKAIPSSGDLLCQPWRCSSLGKSNHSPWHIF